METTKKKTYRIGQLRTGEQTVKGEDGELVKVKSVYLSLGDVKNKDPKYNHSVEIIVRDSSGKVVHKQENGYINLDDPRTGKYPKPNTPEFIRYELKVTSQS